jgi:hypothetical protein
MNRPQRFYRNPHLSPLVRAILPPECDIPWSECVTMSLKLTHLNVHNQRNAISIRQLYKIHSMAPRLLGIN